jgi:hypothetical protein
MFVVIALMHIVVDVVVGLRRSNSIQLSEDESRYKALNVERCHVPKHMCEQSIFHVMREHYAF